MKASELDYKPVDTTNWPPTLKCHCCGVQLSRKHAGCFMAQIRIAPDATIDYHFCSDNCVQTFKEHPLADTMIADMIRRVKNIR